MTLDAYFGTALIFGGIGVFVGHQIGLAQARKEERMRRRFLQSLTKQETYQRGLNPR